MQNWRWNLIITKIFVKINAIIFNPLIMIWKDILIKLTKAHYIPISADAAIICTSLQCRKIYCAKYITAHNGLTNRCMLVKISMVRCIWLFVSHHVISCTKTYLNIFTEYLLKYECNLFMKLCTDLIIRREQLVFLILIL